ncbi:C6 zinc finger protein [Mariannaea sp. PMI_226]|nr:C6 zinc finger protein [Mariannaea sp. PMI_226]
MNTVDPIHRRLENFRESCDNCAKSKVRCGKEQPWCQRCVRRGQVCSYSPSQRSRKRTLSATNAENEQRTGTSTSTGNGTVQFPALGNSASTTIEQDINLLFTRTDGGWGSCLDPVELLTRGSNTNSLTPDNANFVWLAEMDSTASGRDGNKSLDRADVFMLPRDRGSSMSFSGDMESSGSAASIDQMAMRLMSSIMERQHCETGVITTLVKLEPPSTSCQEKSTSSQNLGTILTATRSALSCTFKTVSCTCTPNDNVAMLVTAVLLRILSWYDIILQNCRGSGDGSNSSRTSSSSSSSPTSQDDDGLETSSTNEHDADTLQDESDRSSIYVPPMTIGPFELDAENRERMIGHIVLSELGKMGRLLGRFSKKFCDPHSMALGNDNQSQLYLALEMFLRNKHSIAVLAARKKLEIK